MKKNITIDQKAICIHERTDSKGKQNFFSILLLSAFIVMANSLTAQMQMERLNRGVTAVRTSSSQVFVGWRMFGTDPSGISFNVYRGTTRINASPITNSTNIVDNTSTNSTYTVRPVINGIEQAASESATVWSQQYLSIPLQRPANGTTPAGESYSYVANDCSVGDVDGDGQYEVILKWDPSNAKDNSQAGYTGNVYLDAYKMNGTRLWRIDLGRNIRAGAHYTQFMVYDLDSDGKAEVACKTAENTRDGLGNYLSRGPAANDNNNADYRRSDGFIISGPEYLTIFNGQTGAEMATTNYLPSRYPTDGWGKTGDHTNRLDRFVANVAYLDGQRPSLVMGRGYYGRLVRVAWDWRNGQLTHRWTFDSNSSGNGSYYGQGNHQVTVGDTDNDGRQEIFNGASAINDNGTGMWANGLGHGDALHMSDMNPDRPGQEMWQGYEAPAWNGGTGLALVDARTGSTIWRVPASSGDVGRALASDIDPRYKGYEMWGSIGGLYTCTGTQITTTKPSVNFAIWWDGDLQRELLDYTRVDKWNTNNTVSRLMTFSNFGALENNGTKATPGLSADILGDWREEAIFRSSDNTRLMIFTTVIPTTHRIYTLMHDPQYRMAIAWQNGAYNQPPHPGFYLGGGMATPPTPNIVLVGDDAASSIIIQENTTGFCGVDGTVDNNNAGFTGTGFANANNALAAGVKWKINVPSTGSYTLSWRHANGGTADRPARLLINGASVISNISFPITGAWTTWTEVSSTVTLSAGENNIRLEATTASGLSNIDYLKISGINPSAITCTGTAARSATDAIQETDEHAGNEFAAYPNPSSNVFIIRAPAAFTYRIFDELGNTKETGAGENGMSVGRELTPGLYILRISTAQDVKTLKVIKK